jgi:hypothetical protein
MRSRRDVIDRTMLSRTAGSAHQSAPTPRANATPGLANNAPGKGASWPIRLLAGRGAKEGVESGDTPPVLICREECPNSDSTDQLDITAARSRTRAESENENGRHRCLSSGCYDSSMCGLIAEEAKSSRARQRIEEVVCRKPGERRIQCFT